MIFTDEENKKYADVWYDRNVNDNYKAEHQLPDSEYINYHIWEDINMERMYELHKPETTLWRGKNPNIIFHGGCLGCLSQKLHGINRCTGCQYFKADWNKPNLHIEGEEAARFPGFQ